MAETKNISLPVLDLKGEKVSTVSLSKEIFTTPLNKQVVHDAVLVYRANMRQDTAKTKKRSEVSGGGKKPWSQKGTGRARAGSSRSPIWVGGGTVFGPTGNQDHTLKQNRKEHKLALKGAYSDLVANKGLVVVDSWNIPNVKTKEFVAILKALKVDGSKSLVVLGSSEDNDNLILSARNIPNVVITRANNVSVYDLLYFDYLLVSKDALKEIEEALK